MAEVVLSASSGDDAATVWDLATGTSLVCPAFARPAPARSPSHTLMALLINGGLLVQQLSYRGQGKCTERGLAVVGAGGFACAVADKPFVNMWGWHRDQVSRPRAPPRGDPSWKWQCGV